jgi:hypothetical protein
MTRRTQHYPPELRAHECGIRFAGLTRRKQDDLREPAPAHERSNANLTADSWSPTLNNVTGQVINSACLTTSPTEQIALCVSGS